MYITKSKFCCRIKLEIPRIDSKKKWDKIPELYMHDKISLLDSLRSTD